MSNASDTLSPRSGPFGPRRVDQPRPGYFTIRLVKGGPIVPARILCDFGMYTVEIDGVQTAPAEEDPFKVQGMDKVWHYGKEISEAEHRDLRGRRHRPDPEQPLDLASAPALF